ncbi:LEA type 2 family protein [Breznakiella homolactica]|uniref:LEA type 2 family protein n=1 Tax=Breznakiella homolactica TaxID=2798577 RepID=A0A7T7XR06_9SPIR|nr:LEA type 2 family protein [Breznakiella homolactica]QQO10891.1 LEA type 2 family protein [Breznakiella homolactica]
MRRFSLLFLRFFVLAAAVSVCSCAAKVLPPDPPPEESPVLSMAFEKIEARSPVLLDLYYSLEIENPRPSGAVFTLDRAAFTVNGTAFTLPEEALDIREQYRIEGHGRVSVPVRVALNLGDFSDPADPDFDDYRTGFSADVLFRFDGGSAVAAAVSADAEFPRIREPNFQITSIAIKKAELVNTRFIVRLRIENPNPFPVDLSSFSYELHGAGRFWAEGNETDVLRIDARGYAETDLFLIMNFINMRRELLNQVIAMKQVAYRFSGEAQISTGVAYLPGFTMGFDRSGSSPVIE